MYVQEPGSGCVLSEVTRVLMRMCQATWWEDGKADFCSTHMH